MTIANPQVPGEVKEFTAKAFQGMTTLLHRVVESSFDQKDADVIVPEMAFLQGEGMNAGLINGGGAGTAIPGAFGGMPGPTAGQPPMADVLQLAQGDQNGGPGGAGGLQ